MRMNRLDPQLNDMHRAKNQTKRQPYDDDLAYRLQSCVGSNSPSATSALEDLGMTTTKSRFCRRSQMTLRVPDRTL